jgi:hypothetical protein
MPRKSRALRLSQTINVIAEFEAAGLGNDRLCKFARDMQSMLERNKPLSTKRRAFLDSVIEQGVPEPKGDKEYIAKIDEAIATEGIDFANILQDFRGKLVRGWNLSEKQKAWCDNLIEKAGSLRDGTYWKPDEDTAERIKCAVTLSVCYSGTYWDTHPGGFRAMEKAKKWVDGQTPVIDEYTVQKLFKSVTGRLREMENPKFQVGSIAYHCNKPAVVLGGPVPTNRGIVYDVLVESNIVRTGQLTKRFRKEK